MTSRTHDLVGFTALTLFLVVQPIPQMSLAISLAVLAANLLGSATPDIDEPTAKFWHRIPAGSILGRIVKPLWGGHRMISHSLLGLWLFGFIAKWLFARIGTVLLVDMNIVWGAFMLGFAAHLIADTLTKEGVPWLFPLPVRIGFPPFKFMRITTGAFAEKAIVFPGLMFLNGYLIYKNYGKFLEFVKTLVAK
jgi:membrane-bound metal-dependent hydrolase YbcI (DUF457 family)